MISISRDHYAQTITHQHNPPQQSRSIDSTRRMLDAAEDVLREGGPDALTVEAVIECAGTSTGSFYARFGNREGLFAAMHERFLDGFGTEVQSVLVEAMNRASVEATIECFVEGVFDAVRRHRGTLVFHVLHNAHDPTMRAQGNELTTALAHAFGDAIRRHAHDPRTVDDDTMSVIGRSLLAMTLELMLFDDHEVTGRAVSHQKLVESWRDMVLALL